MFNDSHHVCLVISHPNREAVFSHHVDPARCLDFAAELRPMLVRGARISLVLHSYSWPRRDTFRAQWTTT